MSTKAPLLLPDDHRTDDASKEHPVKNANLNTNKTPISHDPNVNKHLGRVTSTMSVGKVLPIGTSSTNSISNCKSKNRVNTSNIDDRRKVVITLIMTAAADKKTLEQPSSITFCPTRPKQQHKSYWTSRRRKHNEHMDLVSLHAFDR